MSVLLAAMVGASSAAEPVSACPHPYFPMEEGLELTYRAGRSEVKVFVTDVQPNEERVTGNLNLAFKDRLAALPVTCSQEGIQTGMGGLESAALKLSGADIKVVSSEGMTLPSPSVLDGQEPWVNAFSVEIRPPDSAKMPFRAVMRTALKKVSKVVGVEEIAIAGQTFQALKVHNEIVATGGSDERTLESTMWLAEGVGVLKLEAGEETAFELIKIKRQPGKKGPPSQSQRPRVGKSSRTTDPS